MAVDAELAYALDRSADDPREALLSRICTPVAKYWACRRAPQPSMPSERFYVEVASRNKRRSKSI